MKIYPIIKQVIKDRNYNLSDLLEKIEKRCLEGLITEEERDELITLANENADASKSDAPLKNQVAALFDIVTELALEIKALKEAKEDTNPEEQPGEETPEEETTYPEWYRHNGIGPNPWQDGSICTHNDKYWLSHVNGNVWEPGALGVYENIWEDITEQVLAEQNSVTEKETE